MDIQEWALCACSGRPDQDFFNQNEQDVIPVNCDMTCIGVKTFPKIFQVLHFLTTGRFKTRPASHTTGLNFSASFPHRPNTFSKPATLSDHELVLPHKSWTSLRRQNIDIEQLCSTMITTTIFPHRARGLLAVKCEFIPHTMTIKLNISR